MLHVTDGESVAGTLRLAGIEGSVSIYGDLLSEGPAPGRADTETWRESRARFLAGAGHCTLEEARQSLRSFEDTLAAFPQHDEVVIWLDPRLSDQLILIRVLDWCSRQNLGKVKLSLICAAHYPGIDDFVGLGRLTAAQLASLAHTRLPVSDEQLRTAQAAWHAFTSPDTAAIDRFLKTDTSSLPFIAAAFRRHLEQFPSPENGLSRTERQALSVLREQGSLPGPRLFVATQRQEEWVFMGDTSFYRMMADLSAVRHPLVQITDTPQHSLGNVMITDSGRDVLDGRANHIELNGIDRWLGGVHLQFGGRW